MIDGDGEGHEERDSSEAAQIRWYQTRTAVVASGMLTVLMIIGIVFAVVQTAHYSSRPNPAAPSPTTPTTTATSLPSTPDTATRDTTSSETTASDTGVTSMTATITDASPPTAAEAPERRNWKPFLMFGAVVIGLMLAALMDHRRHTKQPARDPEH